MRRERESTLNQPRTAELVHLFDGGGVAIGEFHCRPGDWRWSQENRADEDYLVVFPGTSVVIRPTGEAPVVTDPNHVMLYNRDQTYRRELVDPRGDHCVFVRLAPGLLDEIARSLGPRALRDADDRRFPRTHGLVEARTCLRQRLLVHSLRSAAPADRLRAEEALYAIVADAIREALELPAPRSRPVRAHTQRLHASLVEETKALLSRRLAENLSLADVAAELHTSPYHLARIFRAATGLGVHEYRTQLRLRTSLDPILGSEVRLNSVALDVGYTSHAHFADSFRRVFGASPSRVRRLAAAA